MTRSLLVTGRTYGEKVLPNRILRFKSGVEKRGDWKEVGPAAEPGLLGLCPKHCAPGHVASRRPPRSQISEGRRAPAPLSTELRMRGPRGGAAPRAQAATGCGRFARSCLRFPPPRVPPGYRARWSSPVRTLRSSLFSFALTRFTTLA